MKEVSRRDYFAAAALQALIGKRGHSWNEEGLIVYDTMDCSHTAATWEEVVSQSVTLAYMMIEELE